MGAFEVVVCSHHMSFAALRSASALKEWVMDIGENISLIVPTCTFHVMYFVYSLKIESHSSLYVTQVKYLSVVSLLVL